MCIVADEARRTGHHHPAKRQTQNYFPRLPSMITTYRVSGFRIILRMMYSTYFSPFVLLSRCRHIASVQSAWKKTPKLLCGCVLGMGAYLLKDLLWNHNNTYFYYTQHTARWNKSKSIILLLSVGRPSIKTSSVQYIWLTSVRKCSNLINLLINLHNVFTMGSERIWVIHHKKS